MADPDAIWNRPPKSGRWRRLGAALPMRTALLAVATVWILGCVWSFHEQTAFAEAKGFTYPYLLPLVIDGFAISMAGVAWAASLDARPAVPARLATVVAVAASSASNGTWAYLRANADTVTVLLGVAVPIAANLAFEVLLAELRRQVQRRRGLPPPVAVPYPRLIRLVLAPWQTFRAWRKLVLELTAMEHQVSQPPQPEEQPAPITAQASVASISATPAASATSSAKKRSERALTATSRGAEAQPALTATKSSPARSASTTARVASAEAKPLAAAGTSNGAASNGAASNGASNGVSNGQVANGQAPNSTVPNRATAPAVATTNGGTTRNGNGTARTSTASRGGTTSTRSRTAGSNSQRPIDPRVEQLAHHLATAEDASEITGEMVSRLLNIDVAPRTGRRLLGQARELVNQRAREAAEARGEDPQLSVIGGR